MIRVQDIGEVAYGGAVTLAEWWDNKRVTDGKITTKDVFKKASFYTYLGVGLAATLVSAFGWMRRWETWAEHISHGFLYDLPRFAYNLSTSLSAATASTTSSRAVQEAQRLINAKRTEALAAGARSTQRTYEPEASHAGVF